MYNIYIERESSPYLMDHNMRKENGSSDNDDDEVEYVFQCLLHACECIHEMVNIIHKKGLQIWMS